ncbi:MAG: hypothetical protein ACE5I1_23865 [bacterium]
MPRKSVHRIYGDSTGKLWVGTKRGLSRLDRSGNTLVKYRHDPKNPGSLGM